MPCCHIPAPQAPGFPETLIAVAQSFVKYVGGAPINEIGNPEPACIFTSALHLEMKLWRVERVMPRNRYQLNNHFGNSWRAMLATWNSTVHGNTFAENEKHQILLELVSLKDLQRTETCALIVFDRWMLNKMIQLRENGRCPMRQPVLPAYGRATALASFGLAQKLINIFLKYEICWQAVGQWGNGQMVPYQPPAIPNLPEYLCALHAPIDRILLDALGSLAIGKWLKKAKLFNATTSQLKQSSDGSLRPWSKLDCLRTYYGLQLMLRKAAMLTWQPGCACSKSTNAAIQNCADWFNQTYGNEHPCGSGQLDWIQAACDLPELIIQETLKELRLSPIASSSAPNNAQRPAFKHQVEVCAGCTEQTVAVGALTGKLTIHLEQGPKKYIKLVDKCGGPNEGMICLHGNPHIWLKNQKPNRRYLIGEIAAAGGLFTNEAGYIAAPGGVPQCGVGGTNYQGGVSFGSVKDAVKYLKPYFSVQACPGNRGLHGHPTCDQAWIDGI